MSLPYAGSTLLNLPQLCAQSCIVQDAHICPKTNLMSRQAFILDSLEVCDDAGMLNGTSEAHHKHRHTCAAKCMICMIVGAFPIPDLMDIDHSHH